MLNDFKVRVKVNAGQVVVSETTCGVVFGFPAAVWPAAPDKQREWITRLTPWWDINLPGWTPQSYRLRERILSLINASMISHNENL